MENEDNRPVDAGTDEAPEKDDAMRPADEAEPAAKESREEEKPAPLPETTFAELGAHMRQACERAGWTDLTPVQKKALPYLLKGKDVMVQARTGSGKTGAFVLPLLEKLDPRKTECQALVLVPTRELAQQVSQEAAMLAGDSGVKTVAVYGGAGYQAQLDAFREGAHLVVGTPGRILDHLMSGALNLDRLKVLIFDEADRMLSVGFYPDMRQIQRYVPKRLFGAFMFSATYPHGVLRLAGEFLHKPELLSLSGDQVHIAEIEHVFCEAPPMGKERTLIRLIELENPASAVIFCNTKNNVHFVTAVLKQYGYDAEEISSDLSQSKREEVLGRIKEGRLRFLVATDVAARGIDIRELSHVFLYEPPEDPESYIHRAGRTGRAGASGTVISLVNVIEKMELLRIARRFGIELLERKAPAEEEVIAAVEERLTALLEAKRRGVTKLQRERMARFLPSVRKFAEDEESLSLLALLLDEFYQQSLHAAPPAPEEKAPQPSSKPKRKRPRRRKKDGSSE